jgi:hypothetical protein
MEKRRQILHEYKLTIKKLQVLNENNEKKSIDERQGDRDLIKKYAGRAGWTDWFNCFKCCCRDKTKKEDDKTKEMMKSCDDPRKLWSMIPVVNRWLLIISIIDLSAQCIIQLPQFLPHPFYHKIGIRKVWKSKDEEHFTYETLIGNPEQFKGLEAKTHNMFIESFICIIIAMLCLQRGIFESYGFKKFVTQKDGSMDLMLHQAITKGKMMAQMFNNYKITKIVAAKKRRERIMATFDKLKKQLVNWRIFTQGMLSGE